jgi:hypothetical protein
LRTSIVAVHLGEVAVEDDDVVARDARLQQRLRPVAGDVHGEALPAQPAGDGARHPGLVLGDEHPHGGARYAQRINGR